LAPGLRYLIHICLVAHQDYSTPPQSPGRGDNGGHDDEGGDDNDGINGNDEAGAVGDVHSGSSYPDYDPTPRRDSDSDDSGDSNYNHYHPGQVYCKVGLETTAI